MEFHIRCNRRFYDWVTALGGGEPNWTMALVGVGCVGISIPLTTQFNRRARNAVEKYNLGLKEKPH